MYRVRCVCHKIIQAVEPLIHPRIMHVCCMMVARGVLVVHEWPVVLIPQAKAFL